MKQEYSLTELPVIAKKIIEAVTTKMVLFNGEMGAGKTTLIKEVVKQLGVNDVANSPTFSLVNEYLTDDNITIYHFDFYRIEAEDEAYDIGVEEYFYNEDGWCFIEWGNKVENLLPLDFTSINIDVVNENLRTIEIIN
jgi:tRNA threonylcarbamoyladenosine biosynthesis protein TsaE